MARSRAEPDLRVPLALALLVVALSARAATAASAQELAFARHGQSVARLDLAALAQRVAAGEVAVHEPYEDAPARFRALPFAPLLDAVYTRAWRDEQEILFTCRDGYQPTVPVARVLAHEAWLAFARSDQPGFTIRKRESGALKVVDLAPFYLVWENLDDARIRQESDYGWPYQLVGIDLIRRADRFPRMTPPPGASDEVLAGFEAFRVHCSKCHALNGEGGSIGPELNARETPAGAGDPSWLHTWIDDPGRSLPNARMPALDPALPDRERTIDEIIAYLRAMAHAGAAEPSS